MGVYDTFHNADDTIAVQLKVGPNILDDYSPGDRVHPEFYDGIYFGHEGVVVIKDKVVVSVTSEPPQDAPKDLPMYTKWGGPFNPETDKLNDYNPIAIAVEALKTV